MKHEIHPQEREMIQKALGNTPHSRSNRVHGVLDRTQGWQGRREAALQPRATERQLSAFDYAILRASAQGLSQDQSTTLEGWKRQIKKRVQAAEARHRQMWNAPTGDSARAEAK